MKRKEVILLAVFFLAVAALARASQIYDDNANARQAIESAIREASASHKNVVLDFGANWCLDCYVLDEQMHQGKLGEIIKKDYVVAHISVGTYDRNLDLAKQYGVPLHKGIPALAVLDSHGKLLYAQTKGQFENARVVQPGSFLSFFKKWAPKP
ncbi:MAG TPA: thioredoxin family protein [Terriglobia bacterium]|nr:thioredoxin family protein [Terriglobia bacterium]